MFNSGDLGAGTTMRLRGVSSINGNTQPLVVVDGNVFESDYLSGFDFASATEEQYSELLNVNPDAIRPGLTVLRSRPSGDGSYGSQGANGVIEIKTKRGQGEDESDLFLCGYDDLPTQRHAHAEW